MRPLQLPVPTAEQLTALDELYRRTYDVRERTRAQMVLLALEKHLKAVEIAAIVREDDETVRRWLKRWMAEGIEGLKDRPKSGGPLKITQAYEELLLTCVRLRPRSLGQAYSMWTLQRLADYMAEQTAIWVSYETIRRLLVATEIVFSRPQHTISSPDPEYLVKKEVNVCSQNDSGITPLHIAVSKCNLIVARLLVGASAEAVEIDDNAGKTPFDEAVKLAARYDGPEEFSIIGQELYLYYPKGMGRSKLSHTFLEKRLKTVGTIRNWNTILQLQKMMQR